MSEDSSSTTVDPNQGDTAPNAGQSSGRSQRYGRDRGGRGPIRRFFAALVKSATVLTAVVAAYIAVQLDKNPSNDTERTNPEGNFRVDRPAGTPGDGCAVDRYKRSDDPRCPEFLGLENPDALELHEIPRTFVPPNPDLGPGVTVNRVSGDGDFGPTTLGLSLK